MSQEGVSQSDISAQRTLKKKKNKQLSLLQKVEVI